MRDYWKGAQQFKNRLDDARKAKNEGAREATQLAALNTLNVSNQQVPHNEGDLERDGAASSEATPTGARAAISYGRRGDTKDYAVVQHEDMSLHHDSGRNAKFLENAINSTRAQNLDIMGTHVKRKMGT